MTKYVALSKIFELLATTPSYMQVLLPPNDSKVISRITGLEWPRGFQEVRVPRFHDNGTGWW